MCVCVCAAAAAFRYLPFLRFGFYEADTEESPADTSQHTLHTLLLFEIGAAIQCVTGMH